MINQYLFPKLKGCFFKGISVISQRRKHISLSSLSVFFCKGRGKSEAWTQVNYSTLTVRDVYQNVGNPWASMHCCFSFKYFIQLLFLCKTKDSAAACHKVDRWK